MKRILTVTCAAAMALALMAGPAAADRSQARHYEAIPAECDDLGSVVIEVVNLGNWGTGKVQGTQLTLIPRTFEFTITSLTDPDFEPLTESVAKPNDRVDDHCTFSFVEDVVDDPFLPDGTYLLEGTVGVRVVGPPHQR